MSATAPAAAAAGPPLRRKARMLYEYVATRAGELAVDQGAELTVKAEPDARGWVLVARADGAQGYVPAAWLGEVAPRGGGGGKGGGKAARPVSFFTDFEEKTAKLVRAKRRAELLKALADKRAALDAKQAALDGLEEQLTALNGSAGEATNASAAANASTTGGGEAEAGAAHGIDDGGADDDEDWEIDVDNFELDSDTEAGQPDYGCEGDAAGGAAAGAGSVSSEGTAAVAADAAATARKRAYVVTEILESERAHVKTLSLIVSKFLEPCAAKSVFPPKVHQTVFGNTRDLLAFSTDLLLALEAACAPHPSDTSAVGAVFASRAEGFRVYAPYCVNHSLAIEALSRLNGDPDTTRLLAACQILAADAGGPVGINLEGYLLAPIQRVCKYPLLLKELLKVTPAGHADHAATKAAHAAMESAASVINEDKRNHEAVVRVQETIEGWEGPPVTDTSTRLIHTGELLKTTKASKSGATRSQLRTFFLFDHLLVYCRCTRCDRRGEKLVYKGRLPTDGLAIRPGTGKYDAGPDRDARTFRVANSAKQKTIMLEAGSKEELAEWMAKFEEERDVVRANVAAGTDRQSAERHSSASVAGKRGVRWRRSAKNRPRPTRDEVAAAAAALAADGGGVASFPPIEVRLAMSADAIEWASKPVQLEVHSRDAVVQMALDAHNITERRACDLALVQRTASHGDVELPQDPIPYFAIDKEGGAPYTLFLRPRGKGAGAGAGASRPAPQPAISRPSGDAAGGEEASVAAAASVEAASGAGDAEGANGVAPSAADGASAEGERRGSTVSDDYAC